MKKVIILLVSLTACASSGIHKQVFEEIHKGDPKSHVIDLFGEPDQFMASQLVKDGIVWIYISGPDRCGIIIKDDMVALAQCTRNQSYVSAGHRIALGLKATGDGMVQSSYAQRPINCTSTNYAGYSSTRCN